MSSNPSPCYQCQTREIGCHGSCADYDEYKKKNDARQRIKERERAIISGHADNARKIRDRSAVKYRED